MKHRLISFVLALAAACSSLSAPALALDAVQSSTLSTAATSNSTTNDTTTEEPVPNGPAVSLLSEGSLSYLDGNGVLQSYEGEYTEVIENTFSWTDGWYLVSGKVTLTDRVTVSGNVTLILADGADLTAEKGIEVPRDNSLTITAQSTGSSAGSLTASTNDDAAGIGGGSGGGAGDAGTITIFGGTVHASSSDGAGIGAGFSGSTGTITISGGVVTTSSSASAGIYGTSVTISDGTVSATGGSGGAGIQGKTITISGGTVTATGSTGAKGGAGIGSSNGKLINDLVVTISGGTVTAKGGDGAPDIGDISPDNTKFSTGENGTAVIYADNINGQIGAKNWSCRVYSLDGSTLTIYGDYTLTEDMTVEEDQTLIFYRNSSSSLSPDLTVAENVTLHVYGTFDNQSGPVMNYGSILIYKGGVCPESSSSGNPVLFETDYLDDNGQTQTVWARRLINGSGGISESGWYVVTEDLTAWDTLQIEADVNLILADGVTLKNGSELWLVNGSLSIWAQSTGDLAGKMNIEGTKTPPAAIHGNGDLTIHGGNVTVSIPDPTDPNLPMGYTHCVKLDSGSLTVTGGSLTAQIMYGDGTAEPGDLAAETVTVSGGVVDADTISGAFSTGENGHGILYVETVEDTSGRDNWNCIWLPAVIGYGRVYGHVTLAQDWILATGSMLAIPDGNSLTVPDTVTLNNCGRIQVDLGGAYNGKQPETTRVEYQVAFDTDGDGYSDDQRFYSYGTTLNPADPTKTDDDQYSYTFTGWSPALETVTAPAKYTAQFDKTIKQYTLSATSGEGYAVAFENYTENTPADYGTTITFRVELAPGYSETDAFAVKANGTALTAQNGVFTLTLTENTTITVEGVADITAPENLTVSYGTDSFKEFLNTITFGLFFKDTVTVTFSATDAGSGVDHFSYDLGGVQTVQADSTGTATITVSAEFRGQLRNVTVTDKAGNTSDTKTYEYFAVESVAPGAPIVDTGTYTGGWTTGDVTVTLSGSTAISGILNYQYSADGQTWQDMTTTEETPATTNMPYSVKRAQLTLSESGTYRFRAVSNAGHVSAESTVELSIDQTVPAITATGDTANYRTEDTVTLTATAGVSGIAKVEVSKDGTWTDITASYKDGYPVTENGTYTFRITNGVGVTAETSVTYDKLDAAKPALTLDTHGYTEGTWATGDVTVTATATQNIAPVTVEYKTDGDWQTLTGDLTVSTDTTGTAYIFRAVSASGVASDEITVTIKRDAGAPEGTITIGENSFKKLISDITFGLFFKESTEVTFSAADETSGVAGVEYIRSETLLTEDELKTSTDWIVYSDPLAETAEDARRFVYYGKVTDKVGNVTVFGADGVIFDTTAPAIAGVTNGGTYYTTQTATVTDANPDTVTLNGMDVTSPVILAGDTNVTYILTATDKAGNETQITVTMKSIASLAAPLEGLTPDNVTSENKAALESVQTQVERVLNSDPMTEDERTRLEEMQAGIEQMLHALDEAQNAGSVESIDKVEDITSDNVTSEDKDDLEQAKEDLENALTDHGGNYTDEEKAQLEEALDRIESALESLKKVEEAKDAIDALPDSLEPDDLNTVQKTEAAEDLYDQLTSHEKELLGTAAADKLNRLLADAAAYRILEGDNSAWTLGSTSGLTITANGSPERLIEMQLDGKTLATNNYTVRSGSTIVTLAPGYLNGLAQGTHTLTFVYENGKTTAAFTVAAAPSSGDDGAIDSSSSGTGSTPQTGDDSYLMLLLCLLTASTLGLLATALVKRKRA